MELSVKEFSDLVGLMLEARAEAWRSAERAAEANAKGAPAAAQSGTRVVMDAAEINRAVAEAVDAEREYIASTIANYAELSYGSERKALVDAAEMVRERRGWHSPRDTPPVQHQTGGCPPEQRDACVLCRKPPRMSRVDIELTGGA